MRNIDFRGKAVGSGRWIHGDLVWNGRGYDVWHSDELYHIRNSQKR